VRGVEQPVPVDRLLGRGRPEAGGFVAHDDVGGDGAGGVVEVAEDDHRAGVADHLLEQDEPQRGCLRGPAEQGARLPQRFLARVVRVGAVSADRPLGLEVDHEDGHLAGVVEAEPGAQHGTAERADRQREAIGGDVEAWRELHRGGDGVDDRQPGGDTESGPAGPVGAGCDDGASLILA
jgi:hypothetical protein